MGSFGAKIDLHPDGEPAKVVVWRSGSNYTAGRCVLCQIYVARISVAAMSDRSMPSQVHPLLAVHVTADRYMMRRLKYHIRCEMITLNYFCRNPPTQSDKLLCNRLRDTEGVRKEVSRFFSPSVWCLTIYPTRL